MPEVSRSWPNRVAPLYVPSKRLEVPKGKGQRKPRPLNRPELVWSEEQPPRKSALVPGFGVEAVAPWDKEPPASYLQSLGVPLCSFMPIFPGRCNSLKGGAFRMASFQESHSSALAWPVRTGLGVICFMLGKIPLSTLSARAPLIDLEKTCATVNCGSQIEGLSFRNLKKKKKRGGGHNETEEKLESIWRWSNNWASARGRPELRGVGKRGFSPGQTSVG